MTDKPWTSVSTPYIKPRQPGEPDAWAEEASQRGHAGTHQLRGVEEVRPPEEIAQALGLGPEDTVIVRRRLVLLDEQPVELADSYYPASIIRGSLLAENRKVPGEAVAMLAQLGHRPRSAEAPLKPWPTSGSLSNISRIGFPCGSPQHMRWKNWTYRSRFR
ncbi:DNA-binding GntR family transcriptional regulator [Streptosporangium becharense]|uniref:DNA-binding GntR family transcriptional regulator n=1 Tax=Streptosporangium becharense TaxID=1816182 RepID=A0A7W9MH23_9ACTN|nr:UTRA domain-containing protein [Streptosporangium becharense]MBB2912676.1 DNA-binding GntR family transcriptional regulator [Streptosporangium becharense]MBB5820495.1 DNA-binding GntR family transcriptional regulator [Streptosporangium becharense]